jgi:hypothetical protein
MFVHKLVLTCNIKTNTIGRNSTTLRNWWATSSTSWLIHYLRNTSQAIPQAIHSNNGVEIHINTHTLHHFPNTEAFKAVVHNLFGNVIPEA